jgi:hypothetical protein
MAADVPTATRYTVDILNDTDGNPRLRDRQVGDAIEHYDATVVKVTRGPKVELDPQEWG